jgi:hypothetical protein
MKILVSPVMLSHIPKRTAMFEGSQASPDCSFGSSVIKINKRVWIIGGVILTEDDRSDRRTCLSAT